MLCIIVLFSFCFVFFFNDTATTEIYTLSLHDALPIGCPNVSRSRAYCTERSRHARTTPQAPAATVKRPWSRPYIAISKPCPSSPIRFSTGTSTFSKKSSPVEPAQTPSLFSVSRDVKPFAPFSITKALMPLCFAAGSVFANTSAWSATVAYEIQFFCPLRTYTSLSRRADVRIDATSDPAPGSVSPKHASFSPFAWGTSQRCLCSSLPYRRSESEFKPTCTEMSVRKAASPRSISSHASASATKSSPAPPYSSGITIPSSPSSAMPAISSRSSLCSMSFSIATGRTRSSTNACTVSCTSRCSGVRSKSTALSLALVGDPGTDEAAVPRDHRLVLVLRERRRHGVDEQPVELRRCEVLDRDRGEVRKLPRAELLVLGNLEERIRELAVLLELLRVRQIVAVADREVVACVLADAHAAVRRDAEEAPLDERRDRPREVVVQ